MNKDQLRSEKLYGATMCIARRMRKNGLINAGEYHRIRGMFLKKYHPLFGSLIGL